MQKQELLIPTFINNFPGIHLEGLILLASRPGMGNSSFSLYLIKDALLQNLKVCLITYQESKSFLDRMLNKFVEEEQLKSLTIIDDFPYLNHSQIKLPNLFQEDFDLIVLDDLESSLGRHELGEQDRNELIDTLSTLSTTYKIPVLVNSTLGKALEERGGDLKPMFRNVNWCRNLSVCSSQIFSIYRPGYYGITEDENGTDVLNLIELLCLKSDFEKKGRFVVDDEKFKLGRLVRE
ncbi:MAG TPA: hypothetical protein VD908_19525 [Cytophagales bacterium]|nr:hypothetical protein [Cytophagales bacterium]